MLAVLSVGLTVAAERWWLRTGLFRRAQYWASMAIIYAFMVLVDGWLTKLSDPIVLYERSAHLGIRIPWDIPVEDYLFGFSMLTATMLLWVRSGSTETEER